MKSQLLLKWNKQVKANSNHYAIKYDRIEYTYYELDKMVKTIQLMIYQRKIHNEKLIGIYLKPSAEYIASILAVISMGCAFVPLDTEWPEERIKFVIKQCEIKSIITDDSELLNKYNLNNHILLVPNFNVNDLSGDINSVPELNISDDNLAYILFTSGTSGEPKGVMIEHGSIENLATWFGKQYNISNKSNIAMMTNISFDVSIEEIFGALLNGACLVIPTYLQKVNNRHFYDFVTNNRINLVELVPKTLKELIVNNDIMNTLSTLICGAEPLDADLMNLVLKKGYNLYNNYGPTENTVDTTSWKCTLGEKVSIGSPIDNVSCFLLSDEAKIIEKENIVGELCIKGKQLSKGYYNNEIENAKHFGFLPDGTKYYKTGDLAWIRDKKYYYVGRKDKQIKINGKRIELEEILSLLKKVEGVQQIYVEVMTYNNEKNICVFWKGNALKDDLVNYLSGKIPKYMMPTLWLKCDDFIYNTNGKIDFISLLNNYNDKRKSKKAFNNIELELLELIGDQLNQKDLLLKSDFTLLELGIDSIQFVSLIIEIEDKYSCDLNDQLIMNYNERLIEFIDRIAAQI